MRAIAAQPPLERLLTAWPFNVGEMTAATLDTNPSDTLAGVTRWRVERLLHAGYEGEAALVLALDRDVDLHQAVTLLERGCPHDLALQIVL